MILAASKLFLTLLLALAGMAHVVGFMEDRGWLK